MSEAKSFLILSYTFPPNGGIGGRRWAKFAKSLIEKGHKVEVLTSDLPPSSRNPWLEDVTHIPVRKFHTRFPSALTTIPKNLKEKLEYRLALRKMKKLTDGTPYDRAALDKESVRNSFRIAMEELRPNYVVVTGAPFDMLHHVSDLIAEYEEVVFLGDMRDPWINGTAYGYSGLSEKRLAVEEGKEREVIDRYHVMTMPWERNIRDLIQRHPEAENKLQVLSHFFDPDEIGSNSGGTQFDTDFLYGGALYEGLSRTLEELAEFCLEQRLRARIHTPDRSKIPTENEYFASAPVLPASDFFSAAKSSRYLLLFLPEGQRHGLTKLMEYGACHRPILAIGKRGELSEKIESLGLGKFIDIRRLKEGLKVEMENPGRYLPDEAWIKRHALGRVTDRLIEIMENASNG